MRSFGVEILPDEPILTKISGNEFYSDIFTDFYRKTGTRDVPVPLGSILICKSGLRPNESNLVKLRTLIIFDQKIGPR